jgi:hypothetical protein
VSTFVSANVEVTLFMARVEVDRHVTDTELDACSCTSVCAWSGKKCEIKSRAGVIEVDFEVLVGISFTKDVLEDGVSSDLYNGVLIDPRSNEIESESNGCGCMSREICEDSANDDSRLIWTKEGTAIQLTAVSSLSCLFDLPIAEVEVGTREFDDGETSEFRLFFASPNSIDFTTIINKVILTLELRKISKAQSRVVELTIVISSVQRIDNSVSSLHTSVEEDIEDIGHRAWIEMEYVALERPASVLIDWSTLTSDNEFEFKSWLRVNEL